MKTGSPVGRSRSDGQNRYSSISWISKVVVHGSQQLQHSFQSPIENSTGCSGLTAYSRIVALFVQPDRDV